MQIDLDHVFSGTGRCVRLPSPLPMLLVFRGSEAIESAGRESHREEISYLGKSAASEKWGSIASPLLDATCVCVNLAHAYGRKSIHGKNKLDTIPLRRIR